MRVLANEEVLHIWEVGFTQHPLDQAMTILAAVFPNQSRQELARLTIGQRDGYLLTIYEQTFGPQISAQARCPACQERIEFTLATADIRVAPMVDITGQALEVAGEGYALTFRQPNSVDLAAIVNAPNAETARRWLVERCVIYTTQDGVEIGTDQLPERAIILLAAQMATTDPQADFELATICPACGYAWQLLFDMANFLWVNLEAQARQLLSEVHMLAQAYGWREADTLALSAARRRFYVEMVS